MTDIQFDKYEKRGAYHWRETSRTSVKYNAPLVSRYDSVLKRIPKDTRSVLDLGSGDGYLVCRIAQMLPGALVAGYEQEPSGVEIARHYADRLGLDNAKFLLVTGRQIESLNDSFDLAVMTDVIEHLTDIDGVLQEMHRVLRPGGKLIVTTPNRQEGRKWDPRHVKEFTASELATKLSTYFKVDKVYGSWPMHHFNAWRGKRLGRVWLEIQTRLGRNVFDEEVANPTSAYGQLTAVAYKP